jgi:type IV fimbrial biogenesis protein FimT
MPAMKRHSRGFTLMELLVVLTIAGIVFGFGVPAFRDFTRNNRLSGAANELLVTVVAARNEAVRRQAVVSVCPSTNPDQVGATCTGAATQGYIAFVDTNSNCIRDGAELADPRNVVSSMVSHTLVTSTKNGTCVSYGANGFRRVVAGQPTTMHAMFCDSRGNVQTFPASTFSVARGLEILPTGRASVSRVYAELTGWSGGPNPVTCP